MEPLNFDSLEPISFPVKIAGNDYILTEASESAACRYRDAQLKGVNVTESLDGNKKAAVDKMADTEALLVSLCLCQVIDGGGTKTVPLETIRSWPHRIVHPIFLKAEEISNLKKVQTKDEIKKQIRELQGKVKSMEQTESVTTDEDSGKN